MWARIQNDAVMELVSVDPADKFYPSLVWVSAPLGTLAGDLYSNGIFSHPQPAAAAVPQTVSKVQAVLALHAVPGIEAGKTLLDDVEAAVIAAADPRVALAWNNATEIDRNGTFIANVAKSAPLNMTDAQLDALFTAAAQIVV